MRYLLIVLSCLFIFSCSESYIFEEVQSISSPWKYSEIVDFNFSAPDTTQHYDLLLELKHSPDYSFKNIYTKIHTTFPSGKKTEDLVSFEIADSFGQWRGDCGGSCTLLLGLKEGFKFQEQGPHILSFENYSRKELEGIESITLLIKKQEERM